MTPIVKKLINQWIFYNLSVLVFQSFVTFYIIKYFNWVEWAIIGNILLYIAVILWYILVARVNHNKMISARSWMFFAIVICLLSTCMMQWHSMWLLMLWFVLLWFWKWMYFCALYLYEFEYVDSFSRTKYSAILNTWKLASEIVIPLILAYLFSVFAVAHSVYFIIFIVSAILLLATALAIYKLPELLIQRLEHWHYKTIMKRTSWIATSYIVLIWLVSIIPFIWSLLEVQVLTHESWAAMFQWVTKWVTLLIMLIILRFSHIHHPTRYFMILSCMLWVTLLLMPWWNWWIVLVIYVVARSLLLSLFTTYEKPIDMKVMESMSDDTHSMLPVIIVQEVYHTIMRVLILVVSYFILLYMWISSLTYWIMLLTWVWFLAIAWLVFYYLYERAHWIVIVNK